MRLWLLSTHEKELELSVSKIRALFWYFSMSTLMVVHSTLLDPSFIALDHVAERVIFMAY